jgi:hypothetical protein
MLREIPLFGALAPSLLVYFLGAALLFAALDRGLARFGAYRLAWHPALARLGLFFCVLAGLVLATSP